MCAGSVSDSLRDASFAAQVASYKLQFVPSAVGIYFGLLTFIYRSILQCTN